ncbi:glycosyltransferase family 4 protein [uncultured Pedobacter sp.]|uniref:glycosyltransferase family 4 protein n=1 Tax=uncultured Pedobacter sp. TaxID=246139 RepID=UPI0025EF9567|nr:glycosyltransferase family 4 protein [uncultured Pedobacter sp.]
MSIDKGLKVYVVSNMYPSEDDAYFGVFVKNFCTGLEQGDQINIVHKSLIKGQGKSALSKLYKYLKFYLNVLFFGFFKKYDIIYIHNVSHSLLPVYALLIKKIFNKFLIIVNPHGEDMIITHSLDGFLLKMSIPLIKLADQIVCPSIFYRDEIVKKYDLNIDKTFISASGGVNLDSFKPKPKSNSSSRVLGYVSRLAPEKGWDTLLLATHELIKLPEFNNLEVLVVGRGDSEQAFSEMISSLNLNKYVKYLGFKSQLELPEIFNQMDAFVFPTKMYESLGLVGLEAMACGTPVIGSDRGGINDYLQNGINGFKFEPGSHTKLMEQVVNFYSLNQDEKNVLSDNAIKTSLNFSSNSISDRMIENLLKLSGN